MARTMQTKRPTKRSAPAPKPRGKAASEKGGPSTPATRSTPQTRLKSALISSHLKEAHSPTVYSSCLCDMVTMQVYLQTFQIAADKKDDELIERMAHAILISSRLHNAALESVMIPLVKKIRGKVALAKEATEILEQLEALSSKIYAEEKHTDNEDFFELMHQFEETIDDLANVEVAMLEELIEHYTEEELTKGADNMDEAKYRATLLPKEQK